MTLRWQILVDWDGDGSFAYDEAARAESMPTLERGRESEFADFKAGKCTLVLDNTDRRFDPWYEAGPLYGKLLQGREVIIRVGDDETVPDAGSPVGLLLAITKGYMHTIFRGSIDDMEPSGSMGDRRVTLSLLDGLGDQIATDVSVPLQEDIRTDEAIDLVLDAIGWAGARDLDVGSDTMAFWWSPKRSAARIIQDLAQSEHGLFFITKAGRARFVSRLNMLTGSSRGTLSQARIDDIVPNQPWEAVRNVIKVTANPVTIAAEDTIWELQDDGVEVRAGETVEIWAEYVDANDNPCPARDVVAPVAVTDYAADTVQGGGGVDMTASMSVSAIIFSTSCKLAVSNTHPTDPFFITALRVRGKAITTHPTTIVRESPASQDIYKKRLLELDLPWQQSIATATSLATSLRDFYGEARKSVQVRLDMQMPDMVQYEIGDRIEVDVPGYSIADTMLLGQIRMSSRSMRELTVDWRLEALRSESFWLLGVAGASELGETTRLGY